MATTIKDKIFDAVMEYEKEPSDTPRDAEALTSAICYEIEEFLRDQLN